MSQRVVLRLTQHRTHVIARCLIVGMAVSAVLSACGGSGAKGGVASESSPATEATNASACGASGPGSVTLTPTINGHARVVIVHVPNGYSRTARVPLVLNLHGSGATAADQEAFSGMDAAADTNGFIVAYPQALIPDGAGYDWNVPGEPLVGGRSVPAGAANDVEFLTRLVRVLERDYCVDPARVYATGFSGGARTASQLACDDSTVFAAVAPVSGLRHPNPCHASRPVPVIAFHGTADPVDPYDGNGQAYWTYSVPQAARDWSQQDGCSSTPSSSQVGAALTLTAYSGCAQGAAVELYTIAGEGHEWPGGPVLPRTLTRRLGPQSNAISANAAMWAFFAAHPLP